MRIPLFSVLKLRSPYFQRLDFIPNTSCNLEMLTLHGLQNFLFKLADFIEQFQSVPGVFGPLPNMPSPPVHVAKERLYNFEKGFITFRTTKTTRLPELGGRASAYTTFKLK